MRLGGRAGSARPSQDGEECRNEGTMREEKVQAFYVETSRQYFVYSCERDSAGR